MNTLIRIFLAVTTLPMAAASVEASTLYRCTDDSGVVLYTNQKTSRKGCTVLSVQVPPPPNSAAAGSSAAAASGSKPHGAPVTPTPGDFPRVSDQEQRARDTDRRAILERELANEASNLDKARKALADAATQSPERQLPLKNTLALHERNIEALKKEMSKLR